jgi:hypothetical protein
MYSKNGDAKREERRRELRRNEYNQRTFEIGQLRKTIEERTKTEKRLYKPNPKLKLLGINKRFRDILPLLSKGVVDRARF